MLRTILSSVVICISSIRSIEGFHSRPLSIFQITTTTPAPPSHAAAFILPALQAETERSSLTGGDRLVSTTGNSNNSEIFASETVKLNEEEELEVDFDALTSESSNQAFTTKVDLSDLLLKEPRKAPRQAQWFPLLLSPKALDGSLAGDVGFDPLGFSSDTPALLRMREAELKHARLAMLAAAGWPLSELWHKEIANVLGLESILASSDRAPSVLNGGLANEWILATGAASLLLGALLEFKTFSRSEKSSYKPGDLGFDPLGLHSFRASFGLDPILEKISQEEKLRRAKLDMELCEIKNGRLAMLAITGVMRCHVVLCMITVL